MYQSNFESSDPKSSTMFLSRSEHHTENHHAERAFGLVFESNFDGETYSRILVDAAAIFELVGGTCDLPVSHEVFNHPADFYLVRILHVKNFTLRKSFNMRIAHGVRIPHTPVNEYGKIVRTVYGVFGHVPVRVDIVSRKDNHEVARKLIGNFDACGTDSENH